MAQTSTVRRSSGQKSKNTIQKKQAASSTRSTNGVQSSASNGRSQAATQGPANRSQNSSARQQSSENSNNEAKSGTLQRGSENRQEHTTSTGREFQGAKGQYLEKFFLDQLKDIYYAEQKIVQSLPKMQQSATSEGLKDAFEDHLPQTQRHVRRLEKIFEILGQQAEGKKCEAIEGIVREAENIINETEEGTMTRDAALIMAAQKVEHYEIATYGGLVQLAITMGQYEVADILDKTLIEEEDTDLLLTEIAECDINVQAEFEGTLA